MSYRPLAVLAFAVSPDKIGGMEVFAEELAQQLKAKGWDLNLWFQDRPPELVEQFLLKPGNSSLEVLRNQQNLGAYSIKTSLRLLFKRRPTVLIYSIGGVVRWWPLLARLAGVDRVFYWDQSSRSRSAEGYEASLRVRLMMKPLSRVICATRFIKECSDREKIIPAHKSQVIYSASDTQREHGSGVEFRERFGIPADRMVVLKVSWLVPDKGIDVALRAASRTLAERKDLHYVFCGDGEGKARYQQMARDLGIEDHVTWTGQMQDLVGMGAFRAADLQIQCSQWQEAFCFAVAEGMSAGLPIVASRIGGLPELVTEGENGFLFEPASDQMLATHILRLASDAVLREAMGRSSQARAVKDFELKACVQQWVGLVSARAREG